MTVEGCGNHGPSEPAEALFHFDNSARFRELLLDRLRFVLGNAFLDALGSAIHQVLGFFQAEAGDFPYCLDYIDLVSAHFLQDNGKLGLFFRRSPCPSRRSAPAPHPTSRPLVSYPIPPAHGKTAQPSTLPRAPDPPLWSRGSLPRRGKPR